MMEFFRSDIYLIISLILNVLFIIAFIGLFTKQNTTKKEYKKFMKKLGKGTDIEQILNNHLDEVKFVRDQNQEILDYCRKLDEDFKQTISKVGIIRYSAFKDTGSDLSFAVALLNEYNDGVVLNGIYSREASNIYAKPIKNAESTYTLSAEEKQAIQEALENREN